MWSQNIVMGVPREEFVPLSVSKTAACCIPDIYSNGEGSVFSRRSGSMCVGLEEGFAKTTWCFFEHHRAVQGVARLCNNRG